MRVVVSGETSFKELNTLTGNTGGWVFSGTVFQTQEEAEELLDTDRAAVSLFWAVPVLCEDGSVVKDTPLDYAETVKRLNGRILDMHSRREDWEASMQEAELLRSYVTKLAKYYTSTPKRLYALVSMPNISTGEVQ